MENEKISVIIPVYNTKEYVRRCILSALNQTYENIEVIVVDDGSNYETVNELKEIQALCNDGRLKIIYSEHKGCAVARNIGLKESIGELVFWLDSDDVINGDTLETTYKIMQQENADIVRVDFTTEKLGIVTMDQQAYMRLLIDDHLRSYLTASLMKRKVLNGVHFPEGGIIEDYAVYPQICLNCKKATLLRRKDLYLYTFDRIGSTTETTANKLEGLVPRMALAEQRYVLFKSRFPEECKTVLAQFTNYACMVYFECLKGKDDKHNSSKETARKLLKVHLKEIKISKLIPTFRKLEVESIVCDLKLCNNIITFAHAIKRNLLGIRQGEVLKR